MGMSADAALPTLAKAFWNQRLVLSKGKERILALSGAVDRPGDLWPYQWAQLMAMALEFSPDLILELGRGRGNSTCAFTQVANWLKPRPCRVLSLCISDDWNKLTLPRVRQTVPEVWFEPLEALETDILAFDYESALSGYSRIFVFWDAHGYEVAECVLGEILPRIANQPHLVVMHDLSDARYLAPSSDQYDHHGLWKGNNWDGPRIRIGNINSAVEQAVAITDFTLRNKIPLHSADHDLHSEFDADPVRVAELQRLLGDSLFSLSCYWFWFSMNGFPGPWTFPAFRKPNRISFKGRLKVAIDVLLDHFPMERLVQ
jgi:hypothetical protein